MIHVGGMINVLRKRNEVLNQVLSLWECCVFEDIIESLEFKSNREWDAYFSDVAIP